MVICDTHASSQYNTRSQQGAERGTGESRCAITTPTPPHTPTAETSRSFVAILVAACCNVREVSEWAGHNSVAFTLTRYGGLIEDGSDAAVDRLDQLLGGRLTRADEVDGDGIRTDDEP